MRTVQVAGGQLGEDGLEREGSGGGTVSNFSVRTLRAMQSLYLRNSAKSHKSSDRKLIHMNGFQ